MLIKSFKHNDLKYKHLNILETRELQNTLSNISSDNIDEICDAAIPFFQNEISAYQFFLSLKNIATYRPFQLNYYCQLLPFENNINLKKYFYPEIVKKQPDYYLKYRHYKGMFLFLTQNLDGAVEHKEKRGKVLNENLICQFIINDDFDNFTHYINHNIIDLNSPIPPSLFEASGIVSNFSDSGMHYIEYAAFYGAVKIFKFMIQTNVKIQSKTLNAAIIGGNYEIIHILEDKEILVDDSCFYDAVKSNRNEIVVYILNNFSDIFLNINFLNDLIPSYNLEFIINTTEFLTSDEFDKKSYLNGDVSSLFNDALFISCEKNFLEIFEFFLSFNDYMDINYKYYSLYNMSLLHKAALSHQIEIIKILLNQKGINTELIDLKIYFFFYLNGVFNFYFIYKTPSDYLSAEERNILRPLFTKAKRSYFEESKKK